MTKWFSGLTRAAAVQQPACLERIWNDHLLEIEEIGLFK